MDLTDSIVRRRDMVQQACTSCGVYHMQSTLDNHAECMNCGYKVPRYMTKRQTIMFSSAECAEGV